jgi:hypothetical protein
MKNLSIQNNAATLATVITLTEQPGAQQAQAWLAERNAATFKRLLMLSWIYDALDELGLGQSIFGRIAGWHVTIKSSVWRFGGLVLVLPAIVAIAGLLALFGLRTFAANFWANLWAALGLYGAYAAVVYLIAIAANQTSRLEKDFHREIAISALDGTLRVTSGFDRLKCEAAGRRYRPKVIPLAAIVAVEEQNLAAVQPEWSDGRPATAIAFEVSAYTASGERIPLLQDSCGPDNARQFRTRIATLIHAARAASANRERLISANAWTQAAHQTTASTLFDQPQTSQPQHTPQPAYAMNIIPPEDRL